MAHSAPRMLKAIATLLFIFIISGCSAKTHDTSDYNVVLIVLDTLRADYLSCYNSKSPAKTPNLDRLAREGAMFTKAFTTVPFTLPAHASLMTSRYPAQLGIRRNGRNSLDPEETTLAEILRSNGFTTGAVISAFPVASVYGMDQGFDYYGEGFLKLSGLKASWALNMNSRRNGAGVNEEVFDWLDIHNTDRFFLWVHYYDPHSPFHYIPDEFRFKYPDNPYAGAVEYVDQRIGDLLSRLESLNLMDKTLIVICSDHGEGLGDHGEMGHAFFTYNSTTHIPFIIYGKGLVPRIRVDDPVSIMDITPTLLDILKLNAPNGFQGKSLTPPILGKERSPERLIYSETLYPLKAFGWSPLFSLTNSSWKYIEAPRPELYNVAKDFGETKNLFPTRKAIAGKLKAELDAMIAKQEEKKQTNRNVVADETAIERLKSLGYLGGDFEFMSSSGIDPKDRITAYEVYVQGMQLIGSQEYQKAVEILQQLVQREKNNPVYLCYLGVALYKQKNYAQAEDVLKRVLRIDSDYFYVVQTLAEVYEAQNEYDKAVRILREYITRNPRTLLYRYELWNFYIRTGQWEKALAEMKKESEKHPQERKLHLKIGKLLFEHQRYQEALSAYNKLLKVDASSLDAREGLAKTLLFLERNEEAEKAYLKVVEMDPQNHEAHLNLGMIYSKLGRFADGVASCRRALDLQPDNAVIQFDYAYLLLLNDQREQALHEFDKALIMDPSNWKVPMVLGLWFKEHGRLEEARAEFEKGLKIRPEDDSFIKLLQEVQG